MDYEDKVIVCEDCGIEFVHSAEDQARYAERGFTSEPKRCRECREKRKARQQGGGGGGGPPRHRPSGGGRPSSGPRRERSDGDRRPRENFETVCANCGVRTTVPFRPTQDRPVYCRDCYRSMRR